MACEQRFRPAVNVERLEGRELTTALSSSVAGPAGFEPPQVEVRAVTAGSVLACHNYFTTAGFFRS